MSVDPIYLDWNATNPPHPAVLEAMQQAASSRWGNPASLHDPGRRAREALEQARDRVAELLGWAARDLVLTSGGTEANNLAVWQASARAQALVVSAVEHPSVLQMAKRLAAQGVALRIVDPEPSGRVAVEAMLAAMSDLGRPVLVSLQAVNHETGVIQPVAELASEVHARGGLLHVDAVQAAGKISQASWQEADLVTVTAHKLGGPKGIGALGHAPDLGLVPLFAGGEQERGLRPGTQDPVAAVGFARAVREVDLAKAGEVGAWRDELEAKLLELGRRHGCEPLRNGSAPRTGFVANLSWPGWRGAELCAALDLEGVAISSGAACSAGTGRASAVVEAMLGPERAASAVRISLGERTSADDLRGAIEAFRRVIGRN